MGSIVEEFEAFREECVWCCVVFNTHQSLFEHTEETTQILKDAAHTFFYDFSVISQEYHVVLVGRLTDPAKQSGFTNLSTNFFVEVLRERGSLTDGIVAVNDRLNAYRKRIITSRRKLVAHRDRDHILSKKEPSSWPIEEVFAFHRDLNEFCDLIANEIGVEPSEFCNIPVDTFPLRRVLEAGLSAKRTR